MNPSLAAEWHPTKNGRLRPMQIAGKSNKRRGGWESAGMSGGCHIFKGGRERLSLLPWQKGKIRIKTADTVSGLSRKTMIGFAGSFWEFSKLNR